MTGDASNVVKFPKVRGRAKRPVRGRGRRPIEPSPTSLEFHARLALRQLEIAREDLAQGNTVPATHILGSVAQTLERGLAEHERRGARDVAAAIRDAVGGSIAGTLDGVRMAARLLLAAADSDV